MNDALVQHVVDENITAAEAIHRSLQRTDLIDKLASKGIETNPGDSA
ncbi:hypothetical protein N9B17_06085 [Rhodopirellula sp.]|nr:hypothetical protein [Rhodopirellula sp.]